MEKVSTKQKIEKESKKYLTLLSEKKEQIQRTEEIKKKKKMMGEKNATIGLNDEETLKNAGFSIEEPPVVMSYDEKEFLKTVEKYENRIVTTKDIIKKTCIDYNLKFSEVKNYKGTLDDDVSAVIEKFCKQHAYEVSKSAFYIMAPPRMFNVTKAKKQTNEGESVLFVKTKEGSGLFIPVYKWGKEFGILQRVKGLFHDNILAISIFWSLILAICIGCIKTVILWLYNPEVWKIVGFILAIVIILGVMSIFIWWCDYNRHLSRNTWDEVKT